VPPRVSVGKTLTSVVLEYSGVDDQGHRLRPVALRPRPLHVLPAHAVRLDDAFGRTGGAGGIDDVEGPARLDLLRLGPATGGRQPFRETCADIALVKRDPRHGDLRLYRRQFGRDSGIHEEPARLRIGRHVGDGLWRR
jgi:hypothetical protein